MIFVLDNSVAMRWCFDGTQHPYAEAILDRLESGSDTAAVPVLWLYEASAVLARAQNRGTLDGAKAEEFIAALRALNITPDDESADRVFSDVHRLAVTYRLTSYDAAYLELAIRRRLPVASLDDDLLRACRAAGVQLL